MRSATSKTSAGCARRATTARPCSASRLTRSSTCTVCATPSAAVGSSRITRREFRRTARRPRPTAAARPRATRPAAASSGSWHRKRPQRLGRPLLHRRSRKRKSGRAPRARGTCSGRCRGCRRARGPGRRPRSRACRVLGAWSDDLLPVEEDLAFVDGWMPAMHLINVDLPAPLSPTSAITSPSRTSKSTSVSAWTEPNALVTSRSSSVGVTVAKVSGGQRKPGGVALPPRPVDGRVRATSTCSTSRTSRRRPGSSSEPCR